MDVIEEKQKDVVEDLELDRNIRVPVLAGTTVPSYGAGSIGIHKVMRYGILGCKEHTQQEVGDGLFQKLMSHAWKRALHKLAEALRED